MFDRLTGHLLPTCNELKMSSGTEVWQLVSFGLLQQDMEVSPNELMDILNKVISKRESTVNVDAHKWG